MKNRISTTFRALKYKNYRLFFCGQCVSLVGTWIQNIAISWLVYSMTNSALTMGIIIFINALPSLLITPFAGVIIDRLDKHKLLITMQALFALQAFLMSVLTISGIIQIWHIVILGICINIISAFDMPLRQAFVVNLVDDPKDLSNAISLNSSCFNLARLVGPAIGGILIAGFGEGICFLINSVSYIPVMWSISLIKVNNKNQTKEKSSIIQDLKEGLKYTKNSPHISTIILFLAVISFIGMCYPLLMPIYAKDILTGTARTLGFLMSAAGVGALIASLFLASKRTTIGLPKLLYTGAFTLGLCLILLGFCHNKLIALILMFGVGMGMVSSMIISNTLIQHVVDDNKRGRVMSLYTIAFIGTVPVSSLLSGVVAQHIGVLRTLIAFGSIMIFSSLFFTTKIRKLHFSPIKKVQKINV